MNFKAIFANKSTLDFLAMFSSNIIKKFIGFAKEVVLASVFGSSLLYANFILIRTVSDLFSQLSINSENHIISVHVSWNTVYLLWR